MGRVLCSSLRRVVGRVRGAVRFRVRAPIVFARTGNSVSRGCRGTRRLGSIERLSFVVVLGLAIIACLLADIVWYEAGWRWGDQILHFIYALALELSPDNFRLARNPETTSVHKLTHPSGLPTYGEKVPSKGQRSVREGMTAQSSQT